MTMIVAEKSYALLLSDPGRSTHTGCRGACRRPAFRVHVDACGGQFQAARGLRCTRGLQKMKTTHRIRFVATLFLTTLIVAACGGGGGGSAPPPGGGGGGGGATTYSVSVTVTGLAGSALVLQDNGASNLTVSSHTTASFTTKLASGAAYAVTVLTQPTGLQCTGASGAGTIAKYNVSVAVS